MNRFITSAMRHYAQMLRLSLSTAERITFDQLVSATHCSEQLANVIVRALLRRHLLEASIHGSPIDDMNLVVIEYLNKGLVHEPNCLRSFEFRIVVVTTTRTNEAYWPNAYGYANA